MTPEELDEQRPGDVEALGHGVVHRGVDGHRLAGDVLQAGTDPSGGKNEDRQDDDGQQGQPPFQDQHGQQRPRERDQVADNRSQSAGEGPLRADHIVVETADERAGLSAGEESQRHALHVIEQTHPQIEDQSSPIRELSRRSTSDSSASAAAAPTITKNSRLR